MTEQLKEYLEQEGITHDDVINQEIEEEHAEAKEQKNKNINAEVNFAPKDEKEKFTKKIKDKNFFPIETTLTIKLVDFIDISEFNSQSVKGGEYQDKLQKFLKEHKRFNNELSEKMIDILRKSGLFLTYLKEEGQKYDVIKSNLEILRDSLLYGNSDCIEKLLNGITPPQKNS